MMVNELSNMRQGWQKTLTRNSDSGRKRRESPETGILKRLFDLVKEKVNLYEELLLSTAFEILQHTYFLRIAFTIVE